MRFLKTKVSFIIILAVLAVAWAVGTSILTELLGLKGLVIGMGVAFFLLLFLVLETHERIRDVRYEQHNHDRQLQSVLNLHAMLKLEAPLPTMRLAALSPDTAVEYLTLIRDRKPQTVVELGSGVSTLIASMLLQEQGSGRVIALDHDADWLELTRQMLVRHKADKAADLRHAPLVPVQGAALPWYDPKQLEGVDKIDLLLVDGPPDYGDVGARQPGLNLLLPKLADNAVIVVDDCRRPKWYNWVKQWAKDNNFDLVEPFANEKTTLFLYRKG